MNTNSSAELNSAHKTSESLLCRLKDSRDEAAWQEFYNIYGRLIYGYALHFDISYAEADDILQEVCMKVFRQIIRFDYSPEKGRFRGWLKTVTRNTVIDYLRRKQRWTHGSREYREHLERELAAEAEVDDDLWRMEWEKSMYEAAVARVRRRVGEESFRVFQQYVLEGLSAGEVGRVFGLHANAVYAVKHRVLRFIREEIDEIVEEE